MYYIYRTTNLINGKTYIGQHKTKNIMNDQYMGSGKILWQAIEKYGKENFKNEIVEVVESKFQANLMEKVWIKRERALGKSEYNILDGGQGGAAKGHLTSDETRKKISNANKGKIRTTEGLKNLSNAHKGKKHSEETKRKMSESHKNYVFSDEHRANLKKSNKSKELYKGKHWKLVDGKRVWY